MISAHTPSGTHVVARSNVPGPLPILNVGKVYRLDQIIMGFDRYGNEGPGAVLAEVCHLTTFGVYAYRLEQFDYAELPKCLTELLTKAPTDELVFERLTNSVSDFEGWG